MRYSRFELEGIFVENLKKAAKDHEEILDLSGSNANVLGHSCSRRYTELRMLEWYGFGTFEKSAPHDEQMKFMTVRGLPFIRRYLRLGTKD